MGAVMVQEKHNLLETLQQELAFIERGGYRKLSWRPEFVFEDSPTCVNRNDPEHRVPCSECVLMALVRRRRAVRRMFHAGTFR